MLRIDDATKRLVAPQPGTFRTEQLRERQDLQELVVNSWDAFASEIGFPDLHYLGKEVVPHESCADRIDILAFDETSGRPAIIELKRDRSRLHLLQGLSYAGMLDTWRPSEYRRLLEQQDDDDLRNSVEHMGDASPMVMLFAELFDPEVILTANWLHEKHGVDVFCFSMKLFGFGDQLHLDVQQDYPMRGLDDLYRARRTATQPSTKQSWDDVKAWVDFDWGAAMIERCLASGANNSPDKRYFATPFAGAWGGYMFYINKKRASVRFHSRRPGDVEYWKQALPGAAVTTWGTENTASGISIPIESADDLDRFIAALKSLPIAEQNGGTSAPDASAAQPSAASPA